MRDNPEDLSRDMREDEYHLDGNVAGGYVVTFDRLRSLRLPDGS